MSNAAFRNATPNHLGFTKCLSCSYAWANPIFCVPEAVLAAWPSLAGCRYPNVTSVLKGVDAASSFIFAHQKTHFNRVWTALHNFACLAVLQVHGVQS